MPFLEVQIVGEPSGAPTQTLAARLAEASAEVWRGKHGSTWVSIHIIPLDGYAEKLGGAGASSPDPASAPVYVRISSLDVEEGEALASDAAALTRVVAAACGRPEKSIRILFQPALRGRIAVGGQLVS
jgi:phenylpyruvate tautomerase PptA (4-oxalocrotonate tautomerase family)